MIPSTSIVGHKNHGSGGVQLHDQDVSKAGGAGYTIQSGGNVIDQDSNVLETWLLGGSSSSYEVKATAVTGVVSAGTMGVWLGCSSSPSWTRNSSGSGVATIRLDIRAIATPGTILATATITLDGRLV
jgi:hypothetical protein